MGTDVRVLPDRVAAISVGVLWGRKHREQRPEMLPATDVGVVILETVNGEPIVQQSYLLTGADVNLAADHLLDLGVPIVGFNPLRFDWITLQSRCDIGPLLERTIDIYSALYRSVSEIVDAEGISGFPRSGDYGVLNPRRLSELNLGYVPGHADDALGDAELAAALWHQFVTSGRALIAGHSYSLEDDQLELLCGARPMFSSVVAWREELATRPEPLAYRKRTRHQVAFPRVDQRYV